MTDTLLSSYGEIVGGALNPLLWTLFPTNGDVRVAVYMGLYKRFIRFAQ
jgi:hypothetical protein